MDSLVTLYDRMCLQERDMLYLRQESLGHLGLFDVKQVVLRRRTASDSVYSVFHIACIIVYLLLLMPPFVPAWLYDHL